MGNVDKLTSDLEKQQTSVDHSLFSSQMSDTQMITDSLVCDNVLMETKKIISLFFVC